MKTKIQALLIIGIAVVLKVYATELPGYDDLATTVTKATAVIEVWIIEAKTSSKPEGPNTLECLAQVKEVVAGEKVEGKLKGIYTEFHAPMPTRPGLSVSYANYTGSGQELRIRTKDNVLLLLSGKTKDADTFNIIRVEPIEKKKQIQELFSKREKKP